LNNVKFKAAKIPFRVYIDAVFVNGNV